MEIAMNSKLPEARNSYIQTSFGNGWVDEPLYSYREGMGIIGDFFEEFTSILFGGSNQIERLKTDRHCDICPDLREKKRAEYFIESKACKGRIINKQQPRGEWQFSIEAFKKYNEFLEFYFPEHSLKNPDFEPVLLYAFWAYNTGEKKIGDYNSSNELREGLSDAEIDLYLFDHKTLKIICESKHVKNSKSYGEMYAFTHGEFRLLKNDPEKFIEKWKLPSINIVHKVSKVR